MTTPAQVNTIVAVVGVMMTRTVRVRAGTPEEMTAEVFAQCTDRESGEWKLDTFDVGEGHVRLAVVESRSDVARGMVATAKAQTDAARRMRERIAARIPA